MESRILIDLGRRISTLERTADGDDTEGLAMLTLDLDKAVSGNLELSKALSAEVETVRSTSLLLAFLVLLLAAALLFPPMANLLSAEKNPAHDGFCPAKNVNGIFRGAIESIVSAAKLWPCVDQCRRHMRRCIANDCGLGNRKACRKWCRVERGHGQCKKRCRAKTREENERLLS